VEIEATVGARGHSAGAQPPAADECRRAVAAALLRARAVSRRGARQAGCRGGAHNGHNELFFSYFCDL
jgi:hypothetical protein